MAIDYSVGQHLLLTSIRNFGSQTDIPLLIVLKAGGKILLK